MASSKTAIRCLKDQPRDLFQRCVKRMFGLVNIHYIKLHLSCFVLLSVLYYYSISHYIDLMVLFLLHIILFYFISTPSDVSCFARVLKLLWFAK